MNSSNNLKKQCNESKDEKIQRLQEELSFAQRLHQEKMNEIKFNREQTLKKLQKEILQNIWELLEQKLKIYQQNNFKEVSCFSLKK